MESYKELITTVMISSDEYKKLIAIQERVATLQRFIEANSYVSVEEIVSILGIEGAKVKSNETV